MDDGKASLILGVDGGGTKTAAMIAALSPDGATTMLGEGSGGASNLRSVGALQATANLDGAIDAAHEAAGTQNADVEYAVLALAGSELSDVQAVVGDWARRCRLARQVDIVHDAQAVLAIGASDGRGVAAIVGTGSSAIAADGRGNLQVVGGWGYWFGDQGSGYDLGRRALAAVADSHDGMGGPTTLVDAITRRFKVSDPREMIRELSQAEDLRQRIAALAPLVIEAAEEGDAVAAGIVDDAALAVARLVSAANARLALGPEAPLALAGGIACSGDFFRGKLMLRLAELGFRPAAVTLVPRPVEGSLAIARERLLARHGRGNCADDRR